ncbi:hypothetical protein FRC00_005647, partial [Tulasnella sp. 408]
MDGKEAALTALDNVREKLLLQISQEGQKGTKADNKKIGDLQAQVAKLDEQIAALEAKRALPNKPSQMTATTYHLRHVLYKELQSITESWNRSGLNFYMEVDENVPETLSWPDACPHINFSSALGWIIRSALKPAERKGDQILVVCKLASRRSADQANEVEVSILGDAVGFAPDDIKRITRTGSDLG